MKPQDFGTNPHFPFDTTSTVLAGLLAWTMLGLWLYLDNQNNPSGAKKFFAFFFILFCGPAASLIAIWKASHRGEGISLKKVRRTPRSAWAIAAHWRN
jgi:hypothetical protein